MRNKHADRVYSKAYSQCVHAESMQATFAHEKQRICEHSFTQMFIVHYMERNGLAKSFQAESEQYEQY